MLRAGRRTAHVSGIPDRRCTRTLRPITVIIKDMHAPRAPTTGAIHHYKAHQSAWAAHRLISTKLIFCHVTHLYKAHLLPCHTHRVRLSFFPNIKCSRCSWPFSAFYSGAVPHSTLGDAVTLSASGAATSIILDHFSHHSQALYHLMRRVTCFNLVPMPFGAFLFSFCFSSFCSPSFFGVLIGARNPMRCRFASAGLTVKSSSAALALPRWGIATAAVGGTCYFGGGKVCRIIV